VPILTCNLIGVLLGIAQVVLYAVVAISGPAEGLPSDYKPHVDVHYDEGGSLNSPVTSASIFPESSSVSPSSPPKSTENSGLLV
jgi:hypothetical protein